MSSAILKLKTYQDICNAVRAKRNEDTLYLASELPTLITKLRNADFIQESISIHMENTQSPNPLISIEPSENEAYFIYDNRAENEWYAIKIFNVSGYSVGAIGHLENGLYVEDAVINQKISNGGVLGGYIVSDHDYVVFKVSGNIKYWQATSTSLDKGGTKVSTIATDQKLIEIVANLPRFDLPTPSGYNTTYNTKYLQKLTLINAVPTSLYCFFNKCYSLKSFITIDCDFSKLKTIVGLFYDCWSLSEFDFSRWNTSDLLTSCHYLFYNCKALEKVNLNGLNISNCTSLMNFFYNCHCLQTVDMSVLDTSKVVVLSSVFYCCFSIREVDLSQNTFDKITAFNQVFYECGSLSLLRLPVIDLSNATTITYCFYHCRSLDFTDDLLEKIENWDITDKCTDARRVFDSCMGLRNIDISQWNLNNVTALDGLFAYARNLTTVELPKNVTNSVCTSLAEFLRGVSIVKKIDMSGFNFAVGKISVNNIFMDCYSIQDIKLPPNITVPSMGYVFSSCYSLKTISGLETWNTEFATTFDHCFFDCNSIENINLSNITFGSGCTTCQYMFNKCTNLKEIEFSPDLAHNTDSITSLTYFISSCYSLKSFKMPIYFSKVKTMASFTNQCYRLETLDTQIELSGFTGNLPPYTDCVSLETIKYSSMPKISYSLTSLNRLSRECLLDLINQLPTITSPATLSLGGLRSKLTLDELKIITDKGWTVT